MGSQAMPNRAALDAMRANWFAADGVSLTAVTPLVASPFSPVLRRGRVAVSNYRTVESLNGVSVVQWKLETGRTHQIRVHAKYMGHPLVMDDTYGGTFVSLAEWAWNRVRGC